MNNFDIIILGAGPGGYELAAEAAHRGDRVLLIEKDKPGGTCLNRGCIPTKALLASAAVIDSAREAAAFGIDIDGIRPDYSSSVARKNEIVSTLREGISMLLKDVTVVEGEGRFVSAHEITVGDDIYTAPRIVIATGSRPAMLPIPGAERAITSDQLLEMETLPASVVIIGGGVIGVEFACILNSFGVNVTVIEYCKEILPPFDKDIAKRLRNTLSRKGINFIVNAAVTGITGEGVTYEQKGKALTVETEMVLMAVGRKPVLPEGLESIGIATGPRGNILVDESMATNIQGVSAIGDVNGLCMLAHAASAQGRIVLGEKVNFDVIPAAVFSVPECAMVGLTEEQCKASALDFSTGKAMFRSNGKAMAMGETDGLVKILAAKESGRILGCHIMGPHAADLVQAVADMMSAGATVSQLATAVHGHPTLGEVVQAAARSIID